MRHTILLMIGMLGCGSEAEPTTTSSFEANTGAEAPPPAGEIEQATPEEADPLAGLSPQEQWEWAVSVFSGLAQARQPLAPPDFQGWRAADETVTLFTRDLHLVASDRRASTACVRAVFEIVEGELETRVPSTNAEPRPDLTEGVTLLTLGAQAVTNAHAVEYDAQEDDADGVAGASGGWPTRLGALTEATEDMLRYGAPAQNMAAACATRTITRHCRAGGTQTCQLCDLVLRPQPVVGGGPAGAATFEMESDCGDCPADEATAHVSALNRVIANRVFAVTPEDRGEAFPALAFFRTAAACRRYRRP